jgi:sensor c-di-GMP phosphodiesterase-like protein
MNRYQILLMATVAAVFGASVLVLIVLFVTYYAPHRSWVLTVTIVFSGATVAGVGWIAFERLSPPGKLKAVIRGNLLFVYYQPVIDLRDGRCVGAEALIRFVQPYEGRSIEELITLAERSGVVSQMTDQVISCVVSDLSDFLVSDPDSYVAINLSAVDMPSYRLLVRLHILTSAMGISPKQIALEITERTVIGETTVVLIKQARSLGFLISIDDFGAGYSCLKYLRDVPANCIKIERCFIQAGGPPEFDRWIVGAIVSLAKACGLSIVAEGIESEEQLRFLKSQGVHYGQGWLFSKALRPNDFVEFYHAHQPEEQTRNAHRASPLRGLDQ